MPLSKSLSMLSAPLAALALLIAPAASAETLVYVTSSFIGTVDSSHPAADTTPGGNGPLQYSLPSGYFPIGIKVSQGTLYLLASNSTSSAATTPGTCQLFSVNTVSGSGAASVSTEGASYSCPPLVGTVDFAFLNGSSSASGSGGYLIADAANVLNVPAGGGTPASISINGGAGNIHGLVDVGSSPNDIVYAMDTGALELVQLNLSTGAETNVTSLSAVVFGFGGVYVTLDYSTVSSNFYLYANQNLYSVSNTANGTVTSLGATPGGIVGMAVAGNLAINNGGVYRSGGAGGAFAPALLLPLMALAFLRRRRRSSI